MTKKIFAASPELYGKAAHITMITWRSKPKSQGPNPYQRLSQHHGGFLTGGRNYLYTSDYLEIVRYWNKFIRHRQMKLSACFKMKCYSKIITREQCVCRGGEGIKNWYSEAIYISHKTFVNCLYLSYLQWQWDNFSRFNIYLFFTLKGTNYF